MPCRSTARAGSPPPASPASIALVVRRLAGGGPDAGFGAGGATYGTLADPAALNGLAFDGPRALVAGLTGAANGRTPQFLLGSLGADGVPEPALGGAPPGWRSFPADGRRRRGVRRSRSDPPAPSTPRAGSGAEPAVRRAPRPERGAGRRADGAGGGARRRAGDVRRRGLDRSGGRAAALRVRPRRRRLVRVRRRRQPARAAQLPRARRLQRRRPGDRPARRERDRDARHHRRRRPRAGPAAVLGKQGVAHAAAAASCATACPARRSSSC